MKLRLGIVCIAAAVVLLAVAITMQDYAMVVAMLGVGFALVGVGLLCEATDPRRKPNPRTAGSWADAQQSTPQDDWQAVYDREVTLPADDITAEALRRELGYEGVPAPFDPTQTPEAKAWLEELRRG